MALSFFNGFTVNRMLSKAVLRRNMKHATIPCRADIRMCMQLQAHQVETSMRGW